MGYCHVGIRQPMIVPDWPAPAGVQSFVTTRENGVSLPPYNSFNLGDHVGDDPVAVAQNRALLCQLCPNEPVWLRQVHGVAVARADAAVGTPEADASVAFSRNVVCAVLTADCLPVLFCNRAGSVVAAAHAGWKGLAAGVLEATLDAMKTDPAQTMVWLGPAIGPQAFEVGDDVREAFVSDLPATHAAFQPTKPDKWLADIYTLARMRLARAGVQTVYGGGLCTCTDISRFFSYRRDKITGRMASLIWIK